jgi:hypothetical protein
VKHAVISLLLVLFFLCSFAQQEHLNATDSLVKRSLQQLLRVTDQMAVHAATGICIFRIYKTTDSLECKTLYASSADFNIENLLNSRGINKRCNTYTHAGYDLIIPCYLYFDDGTEHRPSKKVIAAAGKLIKKLKRTETVIEPIIVYSYPLVH